MGGFFCGLQLLTMYIYLNEKRLQVEAGSHLSAVRKLYYPAADLLIVNGYPQTADLELCAEDRVVMIQRGIRPSDQELEHLMMSRHTPGVHVKVKQARVGIAGVGGLGSAVAIALARTGVGTLILADFDVVEPSNLNRQQYFIDQIGLPKVVALRDNLQRINPATHVITHYEKITSDNLEPLLGDVDILVEAFDAADQKAMLANTFLQQCPEKHLVAASGMAGFESSNSIHTRSLSKYFHICGDNSSAAAPGCGLMAPRVGIAAHHQANAVLRLILGEDPATEGGNDGDQP